MTIACCYVTPEGVVFGADSTASVLLSDGYHYLDHAQKVYEIGTNSTLGAIMWGLAGVGTESYRTLLAQLADDLALNPATSLDDVMQRWIQLFTTSFAAACAAEPNLKHWVDFCQAMAAKPAHDPANPNAPDARTAAEEESFQQVRLNLTAGFCIGGYVLPDRTPGARYVTFDPAIAGPPAVHAITPNNQGFWGVPNMIQRLLRGADGATRQSIVNSPFWTGSAADLDQVLAPHGLPHPALPLREVVDFVHACIYSTIKALKFSYLSQVCGGPIEISVISTDRPFRWVRHKDWDAAIVDGDQPWQRQPALRG